MHILPTCMLFFLSSSKMSPICLPTLLLPCSGMSPKQMLPLLQSFHPYLTSRAGFARITLLMHPESTQMSSQPHSDLLPDLPLNINIHLLTCSLEENTLCQAEGSFCIHQANGLLSLISFFHFAQHEIFNCLVEKGWQLTIVLFRLTELIMLCS